VERRGVIHSVAGTPPTLATFLDITPLVGSGGSEQGLLGMAFHPRYVSNRHFYVNYTDTNGDTVVARYTVTDDRTRADPTTASVVLRIAQPASTHNGGLLLFGPDGYLYIGMGDGGGDSDLFGNAQNGQSLLGKVLRIDIDSAQPYAVPPDNPFVGVSGMRPEIWALGLRNPWRYSFDRATGDLYIADVGQAGYEEVNLQRASSRGGENYGWPRMEGMHCYPETAACDRTGLQLPIAAYTHSLGCAVTGGYVYRGAAYPYLRGLYLFSDICSGRIWSLHQQADGSWLQTERLATSIAVSSFGEDEAGELYITGYFNGTLYRIAATPR
jgi:glucose/arabinose dehydrogenase